MNVELVVGVAGAGKSTYCKNHGSASINRVIYHDEWAMMTHNIESVKLDMSALFRSFYYSMGYVTRDDIKRIIIEKPELNVIMKNYFKSKFAILIAKKLEESSNMGYPQVIECPFLDENIEALKALFPNRLTITHIECGYTENIRRLKDRGWSDERIKLSVEDQYKEIRKYSLLIDQTIWSCTNDN